jgi:metal-responsive CopG/Arc/MetJ family transcriptional regulator
MPWQQENARRSISLPVPLAKKVDRLAQTRRLSDNRVWVELIELGIEARQQKEKESLELAGRFRASTDPEEVKRLGDELGRMIFSE